MRLFWEMTKRALQRQLTYRTAALAGLVTNFFFGLLHIAIFVALYDQRPSVAGLSLAGVITYNALSQGLIAYLSIFGWYDLMVSVYHGEVAADLLKPINYFLLWLTRDLGRALVALALRGVTIVWLYAPFFDLVYPQSAGQWLAVTCALALSWLISFAFRFVVNLSAFWSPNALGIGRLVFVISWFFSGFLMPLRFFPEWLVCVAYLTPFPHLINTVIEIYLGTLSGRAMLMQLLLQVVWALVLVGLGQLVWRAAVRRLVILGG